MALLRYHIGLLIGIMVLLGSGKTWAGIDAVPLPHPSVQRSITQVHYFPQEKYQCSPASLAGVVVVARSVTGSNKGVAHEQFV
jgi:hypothetical protein